MFKYKYSSVTQVKQITSLLLLKWLPVISSTDKLKRKATNYLYVRFGSFVMVRNQSPARATNVDRFSASFSSLFLFASRNTLYARGSLPPCKISFIESSTALKIRTRLYLLRLCLVSGSSTGTTRVACSRRDTGLSAVLLLYWQWIEQHRARTDTRFQEQSPGWEGAYAFNFNERGGKRSLIAFWWVFFSRSFCMYVRVSFCWFRRIVGRDGIGLAAEFQFFFINTPSGSILDLNWDQSAIGNKNSY